MSTISVRALVKLIQKLSLLDAGPIQELPRLAARCADPARLLQELQRRQWLTEFQAKNLASGQADGLVLGSYVLVDLLGQGAMGQVYRARQVPTMRPVALKVIPPEMVQNQRAIRRFQREAQVMMQLAHPNIVAAFDAGSAGRSCYLAMEYVEGVDLSQLVKQNGPMAPPLACNLVCQTATALQHAHERDLIHRDIKPSNLMVVRSPDHLPRVKLLDFGLARILNDSEEQGRLTQIGRMVGTVDYISPEQAVDARRADARSDVFSLGATLFYILTGAPPYPGNDLAEKILHRVQGDARRLSAHCDNLPAGLEAVVATMLARDPAQRPASARDAAAALASFCRVEAVRPTPPAAIPLAHPVPPPLPAPIIPPVPRTSSRPKASSPQRMPILAGASFALLAGVGLLVGWTLDPPKKTPSPEKRKPDKKNGKESGEKDRAEKDGDKLPGGDLRRLQTDLADDDGPTRLAAATGLEQMKPDEARPALATVLVRIPRENDVKVRRALVRVLAGITRPMDENGLEGLAAAVSDADPATGKTALQALAQLGPARASAAVKALGKRAHDADGMVQRRAIETLGRLGEPAGDAVPDLLLALRGKDFDVRRRAATALGQMGARAAPAVPVLMRLLEMAPVALMRQTAAEALAALGYPTNKRAIPLLVRAVRADRDPLVRQRAVWAVFAAGALAEGDVVKALEEALETKEPALLPVRYDAARVLGQNKGPSASDKVVALLLDRVRNKSLKAAWEPGKAVWQPGMEEPRDQDGRVHAVGPLVRTATPARLPGIRKALQEAAREKDERLRLAATAALAELR